MRRLPVGPRTIVLAATGIVLTGALVTVALGMPSQAHSAVADSGILKGITKVVPALQAAPAERVSRTRTATPVASLKGLQTPDLRITATRPLSPRQVVALRHITGLTGFSTLSTGALHIGKATIDTIGVDPSSFRAFTPRETASSDPLWQAVARGDLAAAYAAKLPLGRTVPVVGRIHTTARIGAIAAYGMPGVDMVVSQVLAKELGLRQNTMLLAAPQRSLTSLKQDVHAVLGNVVNIQVLRPVAIVVSRHPATYREVYMQSARYCPGLSWKVLAAIGQVESGHGRNVGRSSAGAMGPMQFMPSTWAFAGVDGDGDGKKDIMSAYDAVPAAALYLCRDGAGHGGQDLYNSIFSYNHSDAYVREVLALADQYK